MFPHRPDPATATCSSRSRSDMFPGRSGYCDMFGPTRSRYSDMFPRHVPPADPATATCSASNRSRYSDMFPPADPRSRYCDMFASRQRHVPRLQRHVPRSRYCDMFGLQPIPLERHVPPADPATATCSPPPDPATATCSPRRSGYCDMFPQPIPLQRHVPRADPVRTALSKSPNNTESQAISRRSSESVTRLPATGPLSAPQKTAGSAPGPRRSRRRKSRS